MYNLHILTKRDKKMKDQIKELKNQCYINLIDRDGDMEKFAELIVKMCADAADMAYDADLDCPGDYVVEQMGFGTEHGASNWRQLAVKREG